MKRKKKWLEFKEIPWLLKTRKFIVRNKVTRCFIGHIKWDGAWRQYVFDDGDLKLSESCLYQIYMKVRRLRLQREKSNAHR